MRVLVAINPEKSIYRYLVPYVTALRTAGHEVHVASQHCFVDEITSSGLTAVPLGRDVGRWWVGRASEDVESRRQGVPRPWDFYDDPEKQNWFYAYNAYKLAVESDFKMAAFPIINDLVEYAQFWRPDLVIWDAMSYAGPIAARAVGAVSARFVFGADVFGGARRVFLDLMEGVDPGLREDPLAEWLGGYAERFGGVFSEEMAVGDFTIVPFPESLVPSVVGIDAVRARFVPYGGVSVVPEWLRCAPRRRRVALTLGLSATEVYSGYNVPVAELVDALCELDIEVVATVADSQRHLIPDPPSNARLVPFVPWQALVSTCDAVVHHAGAATLGTTSLYPLPQLALHYHFDQPMLAERLASQGAGLALSTTEATGPVVRDLVGRLLSEPSFRERAGALRDEIVALPSPNELVVTIEGLVASHRSALVGAP